MGDIPQFTPDNLANQSHDVPQQTPNQVIDRITSIKPQPGSMLENVAQRFTTLRNANSNPNAEAILTGLRDSFDTNARTGEDSPDHTLDRQGIPEDIQPSFDRLTAYLQREHVNVDPTRIFVNHSNGILGNGQISASIGGWGEIGMERSYILPTEGNQYEVVTVDSIDDGDDFVLYNGIPEKAKHPSDPDDPDSHLSLYILVPGEQVNKPKDSLRPED